jgi:hypothetical protein
LDRIPNAGRDATHWQRFTYSSRGADENLLGFQFKLSRDFRGHGSGIHFTLRTCASVGVAAIRNDGMKFILFSKYGLSMKDWSGFHVVCGEYAGSRAGPFRVNYPEVYATIPFPSNITMYACAEKPRRFGEAIDILVEFHGSPAVSSKPEQMFIACTACPPAPFSRLSSAEVRI